MIRLRVDPAEPDMALVERAARAIRSAGVVALPTDTLYGLAVDPFSDEAVRRVFDVKGRDASQALPLVAADTAQITRWLGALPPSAERLAVRFWPGPLTVLVTAPAALAAGVTGGTGRIGVRVPAHAVARALCRASDMVLTATSANVSGEPPTDDPDRVSAALNELIDVLLDAGKTAGGPPSTIVDATGAELRLIRPGAIAWDEVLACARVV